MRKSGEQLYFTRDSTHFAVIHPAVLEYTAFPQKFDHNLVYEDFVSKGKKEVYIFTTKAMADTPSRCLVKPWTKTILPRTCGLQNNSDSKCLRLKIHAPKVVMLETNQPKMQEKILYYFYKE